MDSKIVTYSYDNHEIQRVHRVQLDSFQELKILKPCYNRASFDNLVALYRDFLLKNYKGIYGKIIIYTLPESIDIPFSFEDKEYGKILDDYVAVTIAFEKGIQYKKGKLIFLNEQVEQFYHKLKEMNCLYFAEGGRNRLDILPIGKGFGFLSENKPNAKLKINSSFFVMDKLDCATAYDVVSTPIGLNVKNGIIYNPPLFDREALFVDQNGNVSIQRAYLKDVVIEIDGVSYRDGLNCKFYTRDFYRKTPTGGNDIVVVNNKVVAVKKGGNSIVCASGFVIHTEMEVAQISDLKVTYHGYEDILFALQVGNSVAVNGVKTTKFISKFYNVLQFYKPSYAPSLYPLNFKKARAPRIVLGATKENQPVLLWFEGAGKFGYQAGKESCGASLLEVSDICEKEGIYNGIHLDGGGSAQLILKGKRELLISDRNPDTLLENERAVPLGLYVE